MALFVFVTENCLADARNHSLLVEVERLKERVEKSQSTSLFDPFPPPYWVKKKLGGRQGRLIADWRPEGEHGVLVFLALMIRGERAYENEFRRDPVGYGKQHFANLVAPGEIAQFIRERTRTAPPPKRPEPTAVEYDFLYGAFAHRENAGAEELICETSEWVEKVSETRIANQLALFRDPCLEALDKEAGLHFIEVPTKKQWGVWALKSEGRVLLITLATESTAVEAKAFAEKTAAELAGGDSASVLRASRRAYPALVLVDDELWIELEKEPLANMALSPEESEVLESVRTSEHAFPLFINGRAGSGKSTILQYLFADLLFYYLTRPEAASLAPPVYLTASGELLRVARRFVERLLKSEATFAQDRGLVLAGEGDARVAEAFREFQPLLLSLLPPEERERGFQVANHVGYPRFRRLWTERFGKDVRAIREFGPDISWHVIRSYIKGMSSESLLEPEEYLQLPDNQRTVTDEAFRLVHERVYQGWYEHLLNAENLWDDQDLARSVLDLDRVKPFYPAVVCDEAQDFTRLDLEVLLRLSLYSNRSLQASAVGRVPFAFAGDPFQTLNPTGFRWDAIKASFVEKFVYELDPARRNGPVDLNYRELQYNYRSTSKIVRFGNSVQAMRAAIFRMPDVRPQKPWAADRGAFPVVWFRSDDASFWKKFRESANFIVIVPCSEGEEADYVQRDPFLREHIRTEDGIPLNVLSAGRAKGCEYSAVAVYGFGAASEIDVAAELDSSRGSEKEDLDRELPIQYFVNRLYVAVSRPKKRLVVVDSESGLEKLWSFAREESGEATMLRGIKKGREVWGEFIEGMTIGNAEDLTRENAGDPLENARAFEAEGLARGDSFLLKQAAAAYKSAMDLPKSRECRARALEADGQFLEAGEAYFEAGFAVPDGTGCYWRAGRAGWNALCEKLPRHAQLQGEIEYQWASMAISRPDPIAAALILDRVALRMGDAKFAARCLREPAWREALNATVKSVLEGSSAGLVEEEAWTQLAASIDRLGGLGLVAPSGGRARIYFRSKRFREAIALWVQAGDTNSAEFYQAKAAVEPYPENVLSLANLKQFETLAQAYLAAPNAPLSPEQAGIITDALMESGRLDAARDAAWTWHASKPMLRLAARYFGLANIQEASGALQAGIMLLADNSEWELAGHLHSGRPVKLSPEWDDGAFQEWLRSQSAAMRLSYLRAIARADHLIGAPVAVKANLADFLNDLLKSQDAWVGSVAVAEAGGALERAGMDLEASRFYRGIIQGGFNAVESRFAATRWAALRQRYIAEVRASGSAKRAKELERGLKKMLTETGFTGRLDELERYPKLPPLAFPSAGAGGEATETESGSVLASVDKTKTGLAPPRVDDREDVVLSVGLLRLEVSRKNLRCNLTHTASLETAFVKIGEKKCGGEVGFVQVDARRWRCPSWGLAIEFPEDEGELVALDLVEARLSVGIRA